MTARIEGSWRELERWTSQRLTSIRSEARLISARADCLQLAIKRSEDIATGRIVREFHELDLREVINDALAVLRQCLIVMVTSTGGGALIGGLAGGIGGVGVGAIPGVAVGAAAGAQVGEWILIVMGLKVLAEYIVRDMPAIARNYRDGLRQAWLAASPPALPQQQVQVDAFALQSAASTLARGHVAMFALLLMGIVAYLARGRGNIDELADNVRSSKLGARFADWMVRNEGKLKADVRLRVPKDRPQTGIPYKQEGAGRATQPRNAPADKMPPEITQRKIFPSRSERIAEARLRQQQMLRDNVGYNISPTSWNQYPTVGRNGTFLSDRKALTDVLGELKGKRNVTLTSAQVTKIEGEMGLEPGALQDGFKIRKVTDLIDMAPSSPLEGNAYFLGPGNHLPGGGPELVVRSIPTTDNATVKTILDVEVIP